MGLSLVYGLTDRLEWEVPFPALAYRFGNRGGLEVITGFAFYPGMTWCGDAAGGPSCAKAVYTAGVGTAVRWWQSDRLAINAHFVLGHLGDFAGKMPFALGGNFTVGFSVTAYDLLTVNLGVGLGVDAIEAQAFEHGGLALILGSVQRSGLRGLPLVQIHVLPKLAINADIELVENLKTGVLVTAVLGGLSWTF